MPTRIFPAAGVGFACGFLAITMSAMKSRQKCYLTEHIIFLQPIVQIWKKAALKGEPRSRALWHDELLRSVTYEEKSSHSGRGRRNCVSCASVGVHHCISA